ncbi:9453_t:CDS:2, partial [Cetraspora pellucida]
MILYMLAQEFILVAAKESKETNGVPHAPHATQAAGKLPGNWPKIDVAPPPNEEFTKLVDLSKVSKAPVTTNTSKCDTKDPYCYWTCTGCVRNSTDIVLCPNKLDWGLSFDDGPSEFTDKLLDYLEAEQVLATFFVVGSRVYERPDILRKAFKAGHQIGIHTWSHHALTSQSDETIISELQWTAAAIKEAINITPRHMRPPFGDYDDRVRDISTQLGYKVAIWDLDTHDWMSSSDKTYQLNWIENNFTQWVNDPKLRNTGHISLEHDLYNQTAARVPLVVPILKKANYIIKTIASCLGESPYVEDIDLVESSDIAVKNEDANSPDPTSTPKSDASLVASDFWSISLGVM